MADFTKVLEVAQDGYHNRDDYPPFELMSWDDRPRWTEYLKKVNAELEAQAQREDSDERRRDD